MRFLCAVILMFGMALPVRAQLSVEAVAVKQAQTEWSLTTQVFGMNHAFRQRGL